MSKVKLPNFFIYGTSGSGKDTVSNYLKGSHDYMILRLADTIKRIICESKKLSFQELEEQKRVKPELRTLHHEVSQILDNLAGFEQSSLNRVKMIIDGTALDYQHLSSLNDIENTPIVICDTRSIDETKLFLEAGWVGIFLTRTSKEFKQSNHFTEQNIIYNGELKKLIPKYPEQIWLICNKESKKENNQLQQEYSLLCNKIYCSDGSVGMLNNIIFTILSNIVD